MANANQISVKLISANSVGVDVCNGVGLTLGGHKGHYMKSERWHKGVFMRISVRIFDYTTAHYVQAETNTKKKKNSSFRRYPIKLKRN